MFPPLEDKKETENLTEYSSFNYWRDILPEINNEIEREKKKEEEERKAAKAANVAQPKSTSKK